MITGEITDVWIDEADEITKEGFESLKHYIRPNKVRIITVDPARDDFKRHIVVGEIQSGNIKVNILK